MATVSRMTFEHMRVFCHECGGDGRTCRWCNSTGLVCPGCKGVGWTRIPQRGEASIAVKCSTCHQLQPDNKTWLPDEEKAIDAIMEYIGKWFRAEVFDEVATLRAAAAREAREALDAHNSQRAARRRKAVA